MAYTLLLSHVLLDSFSFLIGASCWEPGQLKSEIDRGYWLPCTGPPEIAFSGKFGEETEIDLWVTMMTALGKDEGRIAQLTKTSHFDDNASPCDEV